MRLNTCTLTNHCTHVVSKNNHDLFCHLYIYLLEFWLVCLCYNWQNIKVRITLVWGVCFAFFVWKTVRWWVNLKTAAFLKRNLFWQRIDSNGLDINHTFCFKLWNLELNMMCHYTEKKNFSTSPYHPLLSDNPLHRGSVRTFLSMSFFHSIPSEITLYHSLQTLSAAHKEVASKKDRIFSAIWSKPLAVEQNRKELSLKEIMAIFHGKCIIRS